MPCHICRSVTALREILHLSLCLFVVFLSYSPVYLSIRNSTLIDLVRFLCILSVKFSFLRRAVEIIKFSYSFLVVVFSPASLLYFRHIVHIQAAGEFDLFLTHVCHKCWWLSNETNESPSVVTEGKIVIQLILSIHCGPEAARCHRIYLSKTLHSAPTVMVFHMK